MKFVFLSILTIGFAAVLAVFAKEDPGYVMISIRGWTLETSAVIFAAALLIACIAIYAALRTLFMTLRAPRSFSHWRENRNKNIGRKSLAEGILKLNLGHWYKAERLLIKAAHNDDLAPIAYLAAARAAQGQGIRQRRDGYLQLARERAPKSTVPLSLALAQLQADDGDIEQAIKTLKNLPASHSDEPQALRQLAKYYQQAQQWPALVALLPKLRGNKIMPQIKYYELEQRAYSGLIDHTASEGDSEALITLWDKLPKGLRQNDTLVADYCRTLINMGLSNQAEDTLYRRINKSWDEALVYLYGMLDGDAEIHLARARNWYKKHSDNPVLLLTMGRLAMRSHQWDEARKFLEGSLQIAPHSDTYQELGNLLAFQNEQGAALECYRRGLALNSSDTIKPEIKTGSVITAKIPGAPPTEGELLPSSQHAATA